MNRDTAITQQQVNMVNQVGPNGSLTYNQTGTTGFRDSQGKWVETPTYTATTTLSPEQKAIQNEANAASLNLGKLANQQSGFLKDYLGKPFEYSNEDAEKWAYDLGSKRLDPRFAQDQEQLRSQLIASGVRPGTPAYDQQMQQFGQTKNDAYNQLALTGRSQAYQEALTQRNQPINEISALMGGSQVQQPTFQQTPQASVGGVDYTGLVNNQYQQQVSNQNAMMGGLFGLASKGIGMLPFSDRRVKENIKRVGMLDNGLPVYSYNYLWDKTPIIGLMADEVEKLHPDAVVEDDTGIKHVRYDIAVEAV